MPKFLVEATYESEGFAGVQREGGSKRREAVEQSVKSVGGKMEAFYFAFGDVDAYVVCDFPDQASAVALSAAVNASKGASVKLIPLIMPEEVDQAAKKSPQYRAPGR